MTDRYTKAVEQLAAESETIRLGGIYALERIYADSPRDRDTIGNLLMTFVSAANRNHALKSRWRVRFWPSGLLRSGRRRVRTAARSLTRLRFSQTEAPTYELPAKRAPADVAGAMQVLGRLSPKPQTSISFAGHSVGEVEISGADFRGVEFWSADFSHSTFSGVDFRRAKFNFSDLKFAKFVGCDLRGVTFELADLRSATFMQCEMAGSDFWAANLTSAALPMVDLTDVNLSGAVMRKTGVDPEQMLTANWATEPYVEEDYLLEAVAERTAQLNAVADYPVSPFDNGPNRWLDR
ncbi:pentapeptide repeat-containing protein [Nocardioides alkalitolerans]|uniref:pentapeptide repeat-containing protein n=1 Tax=Nocardioides alkalitolerans TaxID=281714 RepID=UPI00146FA195|nr:pentapeptide repeat-containing protein [Nocardioides alkalitolerans]